MFKGSTEFLSPRINLTTRNRKGKLVNKFTSITKPPRGVRKPRKFERRVGKTSSGLLLGGIGLSVTQPVAAQYVVSNRSKILRSTNKLREKTIQDTLKKAIKHPKFIKLQRELDVESLKLGVKKIDLKQALLADKGFKVGIDTAIVKNSKNAKLIRRGSRLLRAAKFANFGTFIPKRGDISIPFAALGLIIGGIGLSAISMKETKKRFKKGGFTFNKRYGRFEQRR